MNKINELVDYMCRNAYVMLEENILPFWSRTMRDTENGGWLGRINGLGVPIADAPKGSVLNARILWTFSAAFRITGKSEYLDAAFDAKEYFLKNFIDREYGGVYWSVTPEGMPLQTRKQVYAQGFAIYGLSEYYRSCGDKEALDEAVAIYRCIEKFAYDDKFGGYFEAFTREWTPIDDMRLSEKDRNECKSMNTHLHIIEPYTNLYRCMKDPSLKKDIIKLIDVFDEYIIDRESGHQHLFFSQDWRPCGDQISYGHDIEAAWLLREAACVLADINTISKVSRMSETLYSASLGGLNRAGGMNYEICHSSGLVDFDRHWWVQAEAVVGTLDRFEASGSLQALQLSCDIFKFIQEYMVDKESGEWWWSIKADGTVNREDDLAGFWKCPYHNSRMCLEIINRLSVCHPVP